METHAIMWYTILLVLGLILLTISFFMFRRSLILLRNCERVTGTVTELELVKGAEGDCFRPLFKFRTGNDMEFLYTHSVASYPPAFAVGDKAEIVFRRGDPESAELLTYMAVFRPTVIFAALGLPMAAIGAGYYLSGMVL